MKYIVIDEQRNGYGDVFTKKFDDKDAAVEEAKSQWDHLTFREQKLRTVYVLESVNPDPDAIDHMDGNYVWRCD